VNPALTVRVRIDPVEATLELVPRPKPTEEARPHVEAIERDGYTILRNVATPELIAALCKRVRETERETLASLQPEESEDESSFIRTAGLLRIDPIFHQLPIEPRVLAVLEPLLGPDFLLSTFSAIDLKPAQDNRQPLHPDDALIPIPRPHEHPIGCTCMWVMTDFNENTGGTRLLPGSHREPLELLLGQDAETLAKIVQPDLEPGSVLIFDHALFHGAADNPSHDWRLGLQVSYHTGWIRPYTNWFRSIPIEEVRTYPERLRDLLGYKTYTGIGSANASPGSYRENYAGGSVNRQPRISLD
jgi:ectoine hydroxylase-related dioxygenase (phytanoyl-CoA dioxygenase family)